MASIFTFEPDLQRVASPWDAQSGLLDNQRSRNGGRGLATPPEISRLEAEPPEGPVEYKLHLLMRSRRKFTKITWVSHVATSNVVSMSTVPIRSSSDTTLQTSLPPQIAVAPQSRQHRLEQLTTQLLWRLQQSASHHSSSASNVILPTFPETPSSLQPPPLPGRLINGLEESQGALYEIGVADDGTFVGLAEDEMLESITNLKAMAASLGCGIEIMRKVQVGEAEWQEDLTLAGKPHRVTQRSRLVVAEVLVKPHFASATTVDQSKADEDQAIHLAGQGLHSITQSMHNTTSKRQLRVSLTGATSSGKSSLLGTLTTSALDNARGKSRLTTLKHRHEISSGLTSSVSQELVGYNSSDDGVELVNYAIENVDSWVDIHAGVSDGRLVLISDSAGHPRYHRSAVKGLVGWAPHWTLLCISCAETDTANTFLSGDSPVIDQSIAHLDLCLRLQLPLVVVVTKLDTASRLSLRTAVAQVLTLLKDNGRRPHILSQGGRLSVGNAGQSLPEGIVEGAYNLVKDPDFDPFQSVPIVMTSAVRGDGISTLHALLYQLQAPAVPQGINNPATDPLFHIEDVYTKAGDLETVIVAGLLKKGHISVGDTLYIGPFSLETEDSEDSDNQRQRRPSAAHTSRSFPGALKHGYLSSPRRRADEEGQEWRPIHVQSIRNLRLAVNTLAADQVGTIAFSLPPAPDARADASPRLSALGIPRAKKGMVILRRPGAAAATLTARFRRDDLGPLAVGSRVVVYFSSVRAAARIVSASTPASAPPSPSESLHGRGGIAALAALSLGQGDGDGVLHVAGAVTHEDLLVVLHFEAGREFVEVGAKVLVMPGGGPKVASAAPGAGGSRLEGFVGTVTDAA